MNKFSIILNRIIAILIIILVVIFISYLFEPLMYNKNSKVKYSKYDQSPYIYSALDKYIYAVRRENKNDIKKILPMVRQKSKKIYSEYANYLDENLNKVSIVSVDFIGNNILLVKYTINVSDENTLIMKIYENTDYFKVYYDEKLESIK